MNFINKLFSLIQKQDKSVKDLNFDINKHCLSIQDDFVRNNVFEYCTWFKKNYDKSEYFFNLLKSSHEQKMFLEMLAYKLGFFSVSEQKHEKYLTSRKKFDNLISDNSFRQLKSATRKLKFYDLSELGYNLKIYGSKSLLDKLVTYNQYCYKDCIVKEGDYVIDAGGCWGDTALFFATKTGNTGKVWSFEFFEDNIDILNENFSINKNISKNITLVKKPLYDKTDKILYTQTECADITSLTEKKNSKTKKYKTISIDDFVFENKIKKIDFIKADIEGCELPALHGAYNTLKKFKPKLAIAAYHKKQDYYEISKFLNELNIGYKFYFANYTFNFNDTVIYAL